MTLAIITAVVAIFIVGPLLLIHAARVRHDRPHDPQQGSAQGVGDGAGESGFVQHHGSIS
jgi:hypothetical protein